jgi:hypothetical protein
VRTWSRLDFSLGTIPAPSSGSASPALDLGLPLTVVTDAYAATDERRAIRVNLRSLQRSAELSSRRDQWARVLTDSGRTVLS